MAEPRPVPHGQSGRKILRGYDFSRVSALINPRMLYNKHLGLKRPVAELLAEKDPKAVKLASQVEDALELARSCVSLDCVYSFFQAERQGDDIAISDSAGKPLERFRFGRQSAGEKLCLADFVLEPKDSVAMFVCTAGAGAFRRSEELRAGGDYVRSHLLNIIAICLAEALAESVHADIRRAWGLADMGGGSPEELLAQKYEGKRFSFGYAACPELENQAPLFRLLGPQEIGVTLTESFMMSPEASVSAVVFHNPRARYFELV